MRRAILRIVFMISILVLGIYCPYQEIIDCELTFCPEKDNSGCPRKCPKEMWRCKVNEDCVYVQNDCCKYPFIYIAVSKDYNEKYNEWRTEACRNPTPTVPISTCYDSCPYIDKCKNISPPKCTSSGYCEQSFETREWYECREMCSPYGFEMIGDVLNQMSD